MPIVTKIFIGIFGRQRHNDASNAEDDEHGLLVGQRLYLVIRLLYDDVQQ